MADNRSDILPEPSIPPITWRGKDVTPTYMVDLWTRMWQLAEWDKANVKRARDFRRLALRVKLDPAFSKDHPELSWVVAPMAERLSIESEQIARVVSVLPNLSRSALGERETDDRYAEQYERYMQDWVEQHVPRKEFGVKGVEDGSFGVAVLPSEMDLTGEPDFYDRLDERSWKALKDDERGSYTKDDNDPKGRYVKRDDNGYKVPHPKWDRNKAGQTRKDAKGAFTRDEQASQQAHDDARDRYLLQRQAVNCRIIPSLDAVPIWGRGTGSERFELAGLMERSLISIEEAIEAKLGWVGMGNRHMIPHGYSDTRRTGVNGEYYLYTMYVTSKDADGCEHPLLLSCLGGYGTWSTSPRYPSGAPGQKNSVVSMDLYKTHGLKGRFWGWFGGISSGDDDPYHRTRPWMTQFIDPILSIEGTTTQIKISVALNASTGYNYKPDAAIAAVDDEAIVETGPSGNRRLRPPVLAKPGQIVTNAGDITPQMTANVGQDAWRLNAEEKASLLQMTSNDRPSGASGNALVIDEGIKAINQAQVRDGVAEATKFCAERAAMIFDVLATNPKFNVQWPLATTKKPALGPDGKRPSRERDEVSKFDPEWLGAEKNYKLSAKFPSEFNPVRVDLERSLKKDRLSSSSRVWEAMGVEDNMEMRLEIGKDDVWDMPEVIAAWHERVMEIVGNRKTLKILRLKAAKQMVDGGVPGMAQGMPAAMLNRLRGQQQSEQNGQGGGSQGGAPLASSIRGGVQGSQIQTARAQQALSSAVQSVPSQGAA